MRVVFKLVLVVLTACPPHVLHAQDLAPRAYVITPVHSNAITITGAFFDGGIGFNGTVPIGNATGTYYVSILSYYHSLNFFGHSANITASLPYAEGNFQGTVSGQSRSIYRSGMLDSSLRFSVNLIGGPAMQPQGPPVSQYAGIPLAVNSDNRNRSSQVKSSVKQSVRGLCN